MERFAQQLVDYAAELRYEDLPEAVVAHTKRVIIDTVGCALGGSQSVPAKVATAMAGTVTSRTPATVIATGQQTSPDLAAFANGTMVRYQDFNDTYISKGLCHPSDVLGVVLAATDAAGGSGKDAILGMVLGYELYCGIVDTGATSARNWDQAAFGIVAGSVTAARLLGLDREQMGHALSIAVSSHLTVSRVRTGELSHWKGCAVPNAGRNAVFSAMLAAQGMTGPNEAFSGPGGYFAAVTGRELELEPFGGQGGDFRILHNRMKPVPAGYFCASAVEAAVQARAQLGSFGPEDVKAIRLHTFQSGMGYAHEVHWTPGTRETADHSLPFTVTMGLLNGELTIDQYERELYLAPEVRSVMSRLTVDVSEEATASYPEAPLNILEVELQDGRAVETRCAYHAGHPRRAFTAAEQEAKLRPMAEGIAGLPRAQVDRLLERLQTIEQAASIREVLALTVKPGA